MGGGVLKRGRLINFFALKREGLFERGGLFNLAKIMVSVQGCN